MRSGLTAPWHLPRYCLIDSLAQAEAPSSYIQSTVLKGITVLLANYCGMGLASQLNTSSARVMICELVMYGGHFRCANPENLIR